MLSCYLHIFTSLRFKENKPTPPFSSPTRTYLAVLVGDVEGAMESPEVYESESDEESAVEEGEKEVEEGEEGNADSAIEIEEVASGSENEDDDEDDDNEEEDDSGAENSGSEEQSGMGFPFHALSVYRLGI